MTHRFPHQSTGSHPLRAAAVGSCLFFAAAAALLAGAAAFAQDAAPAAEPAAAPATKAAAYQATAAQSDPQADAPELTAEASKAIDDGLKFLLTIQNKDGSWNDGRGNFATASTALSLMAFMVKGEFPGYGPNAAALDRAKAWLIEQAKKAPDGYLGSSMYEHGLATLALSEMWGMTAGETDEDDIQKGLEAATKVILRSQNVGGGWRYQPSPDAGQDTSVTVMVFIALASARQAGIMVPDEAIKRTVSYLEGAQDLSSGGFSYAPTGKGVSVACSGGGLYAAQLCGERDSVMVKAATRYLMNLPDSTFTATGHYYYTHYYAIQAAVQAGDAEYTIWYPKIRDALIARQDKSGAWPAETAGVAQATTMSILILGTPHRFIPIYQR